MKNEWKLRLVIFTYTGMSIITHMFLKAPFYLGLRLIGQGTILHMFEDIEYLVLCSQALLVKDSLFFLKEINDMVDILFLFMH